jgi:hypothetical protein
MILKNPPKFLNNKGEEQPLIQQKWERADASHLWKELMKEDRKHGWAIADETKLNSKISYYLGKSAGNLVYSAPQIISVKRDANGDITAYNIDYQLPQGETQTETFEATIRFTLPAEKAFHVESNPQKNHLGISVLSKCWSHIIFAEWISYLTVYVDCYMKPLLFFPMPPNTPDATKDEVKEQIEQLPLLKALTGEFDAAGQSYKPEWISSAMETKFAEHLDVELRLIATDAEMPQRFLVGDPKGALASAAEDGIAVQEYLESVFKLYEPYIRYWCERQGILKQNEEITIKPQVDLRMSEKDAKELELIQAQRAQLMTTFSTINEVRKPFHLKDLAPADGGDIILGINASKPLIPDKMTFENTPEGEAKNERNKEAKTNPKT